MNRFGLLIFLLLFSLALHGQSTRIRGQVTDAVSSEPIPFAGVTFAGTTIGVSTDMDGTYMLESRDTSSVLTVFILGYEPQKIKINKGAFNQIDVKLKPLPHSIDVVMVNFDDNPAHKLLKEIIRNRPKNNPEEWDGYSCKTYTKIEVDLTNIKPEFRNKKMQKNFGFVFDNIDTSLITGKPYLPVAITESISRYYHRKSPSVTKEVLEAVRISGIEEDYSMAQFTGQLHSNVNFYDNYIDIFGINFASPISSQGLAFYKYFLVDSMQVEGSKIYKMRFHPKGYSTPVLDGEINIDSATYAIYSAQATMPKSTNINWIRHLVLNVNYKQLPSGRWFKERDQLFADMSITRSDSTKMVSILGHRDIHFSEVVEDVDLENSVRKLDNNVVFNEEVLVNDPDYWIKVRPYELSEREQNIYNMVDSIKSVPLYDNLYRVANAFLGGYYEFDKIGLGPYYKLISFNQLEGARFQLGFRTSSDWNKKVRFSGYGAYGTKDNDWKGGASVELSFSRQPTRQLSLAYSHDAEQLGLGLNAFTQGNILNSILSRGNTKRLSMLNKIDLEYEHEWSSRFTNILKAESRNIKSSPYVEFITPQGVPQASVNSVSATITSRLSFNELVSRRWFDKRSLGSRYPIISFSATLGLKDVLPNDYGYYKFQTSMNYRFKIPPMGYSTMFLNGGTLTNKVPYPLLKLFEGNGTYFYDKYAFSCMNFYEFAADTWVTLFYEHHFNGFFLGKIPLMKRLKWREVFVLKGAYGTLRTENNGSLPNTEAYLLFPSGMSTLNKPYAEVGLGVENILKILRFDAIWRVTHRTRMLENAPNNQNFAINFSINIRF